MIKAHGRFEKKNANETENCAAFFEKHSRSSLRKILDPRKFTVDQTISRPIGPKTQAARWIPGEIVTLTAFTTDVI